MALKLAFASRSQVIITSSSDDKLRHLQNIAASANLPTINYRTNQEWEKDGMRMNSDRAVDIVLENGGTPALLESLQAVANGGTISQVEYLGKQSAADLEGLVQMLIDKTAIITGTNVESRKDFEQTDKMVSVEELRFADAIHEIFTPDRIEQALDALRSSGHIGELVIQMT